MKNDLTFRQSRFYGSIGRSSGIGKFRHSSITPSSFSLSDIPGLICWLDPSDISTLFQDSAGTIPVTGAGQPVGRIIDKSGNGNDAIQVTNDDFRPTLLQDGNGRFHIAFDGVDDYLETTFPETLNQPSTQAIAFAVNDAGEHYLTDGLNASFRNSLRVTSSFSLRQFAGIDQHTVNVSQLQPVSAIATFNETMSGVYINGVEYGSLDSGTRASRGLVIGARYSKNSFMFGSIYSLAVANRVLSPEETSNLNSELIGKAGIQV